MRVGSRGSRLALTQAELAASRLRRFGVEIALVPITTAGDRDRSRPFGEIGSRGVFVKEIEEALLDGRIDVAVHSAKDMTSSDTEGLAVGAYLVVFVAVLAWVAIIAAKLARLERDAGELAELARRKAERSDEREKVSV